MAGAASECIERRSERVVKRGGTEAWGGAAVQNKAKGFKFQQIKSKYNGCAVKRQPTPLLGLGFRVWDLGFRV